MRSWGSSRRNLCRIVTGATLAVLAAAALACGRLGAVGGSDVVFPRLDSGREQFYYAAAFDQQVKVGSSTDRADERLRSKIKAYQMVLDHFADDQIYAPLAEVGIGNCYFRLKDHRKTIRVFQNLEERYPNYPFIHAEAEWMIGRSLENLGDNADAKRHYKRCIDTFQYNKNEEIKTIVALCKDRYIQPSVPRRPRK